MSHDMYMFKYCANVIHPPEMTSYLYKKTTSQNLPVERLFENYNWLTGYGLFIILVFITSNGIVNMVARHPLNENNIIIGYSLHKSQNAEIIHTL